MHPPRVIVDSGSVPVKRVLAGRAWRRVQSGRRCRSTAPRRGSPIDTLSFYVSQNATGLLAASALLIAALGIGLPLARRLGLQETGPLLDGCFAAGLGIFLLVAGGQALGIAGRFHANTVRWALVLPLAFGLWNAGRWFLVEAAEPLGRLLSRKPILVAALVPLSASYLVLALPPAVFYDTLLYHLGAPHAWLLDGSTLPEPGVVYTGFPMQSETLLAEALALGGVAAGPLAHAGVTLLLLLTAAAVAARHAGPAAGLTAALVVGSLPMTPWLAFLLKPEVPGALFALLAVALVLEERRGAGRLLACGLFLALSAACKPTNALYIALPVGLWLLLARGEPGSRLSRAGWGALGGLLGALPWAARDLAFRLTTGEASGLGALPAAARSAILTDMQAVSAADLPGAALRALQDPLLGGSGSGAEPTWQWLLLLPLALLAAWRRPWVRPLLLCAAAALLLRAGTTHTLRFGYAAFPLLAVAAAASIPLPGERRAARRSLWAGAAILATGTFLLALVHIDQVFSVRSALASADGARRYLAGQEPSLRGFEWIDSHTPADARVLLVGETRRLRLQRSHVVADFVHPNPLHRLLAASSTPAEVSAGLADLGITHLLLHPGEEARLLKKYQAQRLGRRERQLVERFYREELDLLWSENGVHIFRLLPGNGARTPARP